MADRVFIITKAVGVLQLIAGIIVAIAMIYLFTFGVYPQDDLVLYYEMACATGCSTGILLGIESIFFASKNNRGLRNGFIFAILLSLIVGSVILYFASKFKNIYLGETIMEGSKDYWDERVLRIYYQCYFLGVAAAGILLFTILPLLYLVYVTTESK